MGQVLSLALSVGVPLVGGIGIGLSLRDDVKTWYPTIKKPSWNPPNYLFGPVWTVLYTAMGVASWRVLRAGGGALPLGLYGLQLALNLSWSPLFFKAHNLKAATADITVLLGVLGATILEFNKVDPVAAALLLPYLGWTSFASALTWNIFLNNPDEGKQAKREAGTAREAAPRTAAPAAVDKSGDVLGSDDPAKKAHEITENALHKAAKEQ